VPENAPEDWLRAIEEIANKPSVTLLTGPSSSGKSTFAKRLLNRFLTGVGKSAKAVPAVCYLDLDPSNPEYTPEGQISLAYVTELNLSPSFVRPIHKASGRGDNQFVVAHPLPILNFPDYEEYFTSCVSALFKVFKDNLHDGDTTRPLIINTPPSLYTTHFPLLQSIIKLLKPNHIIHLGDITAIEPDTAFKLDTLQTLAKKSGTTLHELAAQFPPLPPARTASQRRAMQMQSYFHRAPANADDKTWDHGGMTWDTRPLSHFTPWELYYEETATRTQDLLGILPLFDALPPARLLTALNGSIIHIVETSCPTTQALYQKLPKTTQHGLPYFPADTATGMTQPLSPQTSKIVCMALIRGFDLDAKVIQIVVPKTHEPLLRTLTPEKTVFVAGCCDTPEWAYTEDAYAQLDARTNDAQLGGGSMKENVLTEGVELPPWVEKKSVMDGMGYLNTVRRVRKFLG
jgi:polynucleotide 5'-hydroxyl-kinase GRC3/NOL9